MLQQHKEVDARSFDLGYGAGYAKAENLRVALRAARDWLRNNPDYMSRDDLLCLIQDTIERDAK